MFKYVRQPYDVPRGKHVHGLLGDEEGAIYVEYIVLTLLIAVGVSAALLAIGLPMVESFRTTRLFLAMPIP